MIPDEIRGFFYQINYTLTEVEADRADFHAQFRRQNPLPYKEVYTILAASKGKGILWCLYGLGVNNNLWWGEGEIKFIWTVMVNIRPSVDTGTEDQLRRRLGL